MQRIVAVLWMFNFLAISRHLSIQAVHETVADADVDVFGFFFIWIENDGLRREALVNTKGSIRRVSNILSTITVGGQKKLHLQAQVEQENYKHKWDT